ncbi:MAG: methyltransferase domain-containing protein [Pseudomonadota bacterium]
MGRESQYSRAVVDSMEEIFGKGFLSPGGPEEIARIFDGLDLTGLRVLDWGCGLGGATMALARDLGAGQVLGIDVDEGNLAHAKANIDAAGLTEPIALQLVEPGPLPLADGDFDVVFTQAALCHIDDKAAVLSEYHRVLKPGGRLVASDWMTGHDGPLSKAYHQWDEVLRQEGLIFFFKSVAHHEKALAEAGFTEIAITDNSAHTGALARDFLDHIEGAGQTTLLGSLGDDGYERFLLRANARIEALDSGDLRLCHLRART